MTKRIRRVTDYLPYIKAPIALRLANTGVCATGALLPSGQVSVSVGSTICQPETPSMRAGVGDLRRRLLNQKVIVNNTFVKPWISDNPSQSANVILASRTSGLVQWMETSSRTPLGDYLEELKRKYEMADGPWVYVDPYDVDGHYRRPVGYLEEQLRLKDPILYHELIAKRKQIVDFESRIRISLKVDWQLTSLGLQERPK